MLIQDLYLENPLFSGQNVHDVLTAVHGVDLSVRTVERVIAKIPDWERLLRRGGPAAENEMLRAKLLREVPRPNHTWFIDHSFLRQEIVTASADACSDYDFAFSAVVRTWDRAGQEVITRTDRLHMTVVQDARTRLILALRIWPRVPTTRETLITIWEAASRYGLPERLYSDNGSDFRSHDVGAALREIGVPHIFSLPYAPEGRSKVERLFRTIKSRVMVHLPGYRGDRPPEEISDEELLPVEEVERRVRGGVELFIQNRVHGATGRIPHEHFIEEAGARAIPPEPERLLCLLQAHEERNGRALPQPVVLDGASGGLYTRDPSSCAL